MAALPYQGPQPDEPEASIDVVRYEHPPTDLDLILRDPVLQWRASQMTRAGMTVFQARKLALDNRVDLHFVIHRLIGRGCSPDLAFDIASS